MSREQYHLAINAAELHSFRFLASVLLCLYRKDFPADFPASRLEQAPAPLTK